jgi:cold shock protein
MVDGVISRLTDKGYGFISSEVRDKDFFFHSDELVSITFDELRCGDEVHFNIEATVKGVAACQVRLFEESVYSGHRELPPASLEFESSVSECTTELVQYINMHPEMLHSIHPGTFENLVAEIFRQEGYHTEKISGWNQPDGGVDLIAVRQLAPGDHLRLAIQCKRHGGSRRISAEPLRALAGVLDRFEAHKGVVATTGSFSQAAEEERTKYLWRISLRDYHSIVSSLKRMNLTSAN